MLKLFDNKRRLFFFPVRWANSVYRWLTGVHSPTGTINIRNTIDPSEAGSCQFDVDVPATARALQPLLDNRYIRRSELVAALQSVLSLAAFNMDGGKISLRTSYIQQVGGGSGSGTGSGTYCVRPVYTDGVLTALQFGTDAELAASTPSSIVYTTTCPNAS